MSEDSEEHKRLLQLVRRTAREVAYEVMDEHLADYRHEEKSAQDVLENEDLGPIVEPLKAKSSGKGEK